MHDVYYIQVPAFIWYKGRLTGIAEEEDEQ